ncbi:MAG: glycosyltransferase family 9 protein [Planctomycetota bacterium]
MNDSPPVGTHAPAAAPRILIVKLTALGDILHALPVARALRRRFPTAYIAWAVQTAADLLASDPDLDAVIDVGRGCGLVGGWRWYRGMKRQLRSHRFDTAIDLQGLAKSGLVARASGAAAVVGFGGLNCRELNWFFTTHRIVPPAGVHVARQNLALLGHFGIETVLDIPGLHTTAEDETFAAALIRDHTAGTGAATFILVHPGVSRANKQWPADRFARLCELMAGEFPCAVLLAGGSEVEQALCATIAARTAGPRPPRVLPRMGLGRFAALVKRARLFVGHDSGPTQMAFHAGVPSVFLFGPTLPWRNGAYACATGRGINIVASPEHVARQTRPYVRDTGLMERIEPAAVMEAVRTLLQSPGAGTARLTPGP